MSKFRRDSEMITVAEAARIMKTYSKQVHRLIARGKLEGAYKISDAKTAAYLIPLESVEAYIAQQKAEKKRGAATK
jgi:hypothetical protein